MPLSTTHRLLALDSSAHLRSYRRNLGPFRGTADGVERLAQHQRHGTEMYVHVHGGLAAPAGHPPALLQRVARARGNVPALLRAAIEHGKTFADDGAVYEVWEDGAGGERRVVGMCRGLHGANEGAVQHFVDKYLGAALGVPEVEVVEGGRIRCAVETEGSRGGYKSVYVRQAKGVGGGL